MAISLLIAGNENDARKAGRRFGVEIRFRETTAYNETLAYANDYDHSRVFAWYNDPRPHDAGRSGVLLHYTVFVDEN
jgi:hypothetical protein